MPNNEAPQKLVDDLNAFLISLGLSTDEAKNDAQWALRYYERTSNPIVLAVIAGDLSAQAEIKTHIGRVTPLMAALGYRSTIRQAISIYGDIWHSMKDNQIFQGAAIAALGMLPTDEARTRWLNNAVYGSLPEDSPSSMRPIQDWLTKAVMGIDMARSSFITRLHATQTLSQPKIYDWAVRLFNHENDALEIFKNYHIDSWKALEEFVSYGDKQLEGIDALLAGIIIIAEHEFDVECNGQYAGYTYFPTGEQVESEETPEEPEDDSWLTEDQQA